MRHERVLLFLIVLSLLCVGVIMIYSTSAVYAFERYRDTAYFLKRHLVYLAVGVVLFLWVLSLDPDQIRRWVKPLLALTLVSLAAVLLPGLGRRVSGASRWFRVGSFSFQPSEMAQVAVILYLAEVLTRKRHDLTHFFRGVVPPLLVLEFLHQLDQFAGQGRPADELEQLPARPFIEGRPALGHLRKGLVALAGGQKKLLERWLGPIRMRGQYHDHRVQSQLYGYPHQQAVFGDPPAADVF